MFQVLDNEKPADCFHHNVHPSWNQSKFSSIEEANKYITKWLGYSDEYPICLELNQKYDYSGYGDSIQIKQI